MSDFAKELERAKKAVVNDEPFIIVPKEQKPHDGKPLLWLPGGVRRTRDRGWWGPSPISEQYQQFRSYYMGEFPDRDVRYETLGDPERLKKADYSNAVSDFTRSKVRGTERLREFLRPDLGEPYPLPVADTHVDKATGKSYAAFTIPCRIADGVINRPYIGPTPLADEKLAEKLTKDDDTYKYRAGNGAWYENATGHSGCTTIQVLEFLKGQPFNNLALAFIHAQQPSKIRVIGPDKCETTDVHPQRINVYLLADGRIERITQEVSVAYSCGADVNRALQLQKQALGNGLKKSTDKEPTHGEEDECDE